MQKIVQIPLRGFMECNETIVLPVDEALKAVDEDRFHTARTAKKEKVGELIEFISTWYKCNVCFDDLYYSILTPQVIERLHSDTNFITYDAFSNWISQNKLLADEDKVFEFSGKVDADYEMECKCGHISKIKTPGEIHIWSDSHMTQVTQVVEYMDRECALPLSFFTLDYKMFPVTVKIVFDHVSRKTYFCVYDSKQKLLTNYVIDEIGFAIASPHNDPMKEFMLRKLISFYEPLQNALLEAFGQFYNGKVPFKEREVSLEILALLNQYQGFPKNFYDAIPLYECTLKVYSKHFEMFATILDRYENTPKIYEAFKLPNIKSIKRIVYQNPALLFYIDAIKALPFKNIDILVQILEWEGVYYLLSKLLAFPKLNNYIAEIIKNKGEVQAWKEIKKNYHQLIKQASLYYLSDGIEVDINYIKIRAVDDDCYIMHNIPVQTNGRCFVNFPYTTYYDFQLLRSTYEQKKAGIVLNNCLSRFNYNERVVVGIKQKGVYIACLEIIDDIVIQASDHDNTPIEDNKSLFWTVRDWMELNNLSW